MKFMVSAGFQGSSEERNALIPQEQAHIKALREKGIVEALYISADHPYVGLSCSVIRRNLFFKHLQSLPLYPYMQPEITPLM